MRQTASRHLTTVIAAIVAGLLVSVAVARQGQVQSAATTAAPQVAAGSKMAFAVASIRPAGPLYRIDITTSGPRLDAVGENVLGLIMYGYDVKNYQFADTPIISAVENVNYDIHAEADGDATPTEDQFRMMMQSLLADRFKLTFHREMRQTPVYALVVGKNGPKFKESAPNADFSGYHGVDGRNQSMTLTKATMEQVTRDLQVYADKPIVDKTGLTGTYDIKVEAAPYRGTDVKEGDISIFSAVQEQLGLKLVPQKDMVEMMIVDHVEKPSPN